MSAPIFEAAWLVPALPLLGAAILLFAGKRMSKAAGGLATVMMAGSFSVGLWIFFELLSMPAAERLHTSTLYTFIKAGTFEVALDYRIDPLSVLMILVVTGVGSLIHLYSIGYMRGDERESRFFAYMNLFAFSMLLLVMANNMLIMYVGWELVGLSSYLLIGFWFERPAASTAAKKAFITNRVGDVGFALGIMLIFVHFGTLDFSRVLSEAGALGTGAATAIALLLFAGAAGKSAQIPLHVWLPDAMEGPTPVSALIHAATMVTAGVYMVGRAHPIFAQSPVAMDVVAWIGLATALLAAFIAFTQDDIKRVLAYSTVSQLGFMFLALGVGATSAAIFHLFTHAFFKALMFLGAGSVMHGSNDETDITKMGGLGRAMPWTAATFVIGWFAIIGVPGFSGFFSKDQILAGVYGSGGTILWVGALVATFGTGFYMSRLVFLTFFGPSRAPEGVRAHESPAVMVWPLALLAVAAAGAGWFGATVHGGGFHRFVAPSVCAAHDPAHVAEQPRVQTCTVDAATGEVHPLEREGGAGELVLGSVATAAGVAGLGAAGFMYLGGFPWQRRRERPTLVWKASRNKFFVDEVYQFLFTGVGKAVAATAAFVVDRRVIDGTVSRLAHGVGALSVVGRKLQTGMVRTYAVGVLGGVVALGVLLVARAR
ncbi:MAG TPA: NADH-quinone oxidoreductase subunit L [Actinomycetota bacterium]